MQRLILSFLILFTSFTSFGIGAITGFGTVCRGGMITLADTSVGGIWSSSNPAIGTITAFTGVFTGIAVGSVTITYTVGGYFATKTCTVVSSPAPILGSPHICIGHTRIFTDDTAGGIWWCSNTAIATIDSTGIATGISPGTCTIAYTLDYLSAVCTFEVFVTVNPTPVLSSPLNPPLLCDSSIFNYVPLSTTLGTTFLWNRSDITGIMEPHATGFGSIHEQLINTTSLPISVPYVYISTLEGCSDTQNVIVTVNPTPVLSSTLTPPTICDSVMFNYIATSFTPSATFAWNRPAVLGITPLTSFGTGNITELLTETATSPVAVTYVYKLGVAGCINAATQNVVVSVNPCSAHLFVENLSGATEKIMVYPVPATQQITVISTNRIISITILTLLGQTVYTHEYNSEKIVVDVADLPTDVYFIKINGTEVRKFVKE